MSPIRCTCIVALISAFTLPLTVPSQALAGYGYTSFFLIDQLETDSGETGFKIVPNGTVKNLPGCASSTAYHMVDDEFASGNSQRLSIALSALAAGREVRVWILNCSAEDLPRAWGIDVR